MKEAIKNKESDDQNGISLDKKVSEEKKVDHDKGRKLGDEWIDWNGKLIIENITSGKGVFLIFAFGAMVLFNLITYGLYYLVIPRLNQFNSILPTLVLILLIALSCYFLFWYIVIVITSYTRIKLNFLGMGNRLLLGFLLENVFKIGDWIRYSRDKLGHSFVKVSNSFVRGTKKWSGHEKLLLLLPRCLTKESYEKIKEISKANKVEIAVCTGGEAARKKVKEFRPTAIIGVACERDLVSGIKDVGKNVSVLGIPNIRPEGPCKNTEIDFDALRSSIQFYLS